VTGSESLEESKDPDSCNVFALMKFFASSERLQSIREKYLAGGY